MNSGDDIQATSMIGRTVGVYRLEGEVGRGGMGVVFRASRIDGEFEQTVAVKLIKRGMDTDLILKRFRRERQITAALNHPNIAYFFGGGSTDDGLPYFVMEFIEGEPLYKYCDSRKLDIRTRLQIFRQICWAVAAAHGLGVVHRDLKPSNVLVNTSGKPKLLDFGIAKVLDPDLMVTEMDPTATQLRVMTPEYASPEQIDGREIGAASDIYSLGVILYELLTGHRPYALHRRSSSDMLKAIAEQMPTPPSGSITRDEDIVPVEGAESVERVVSARGASVNELRKTLSGDLDRIVLKALRKEPGERYASAVDLADDIGNFLEGRPVEAEFFTTSPDAARRRRDVLSIAILPLKVFGAPDNETGDEFLGIGLADSLIAKLSDVRRLVVRPTTSVLPFSDVDPAEAGRDLDVDYVLTGHVRILQGRVRVSVQLFDVSERSTKWARAFDEDSNEILELEEMIANQVATALLPHLTAEERLRLERRGTHIPEAYQAYMRGRYFWSRFTDKDLLRAVKEFERAIDLDPDYALPYIGLADYYAWSAIFGEIPSKEGFSKAADAAGRALTIDPGLGPAYAMLAFAKLLCDWDWDEAFEIVQRALELAPNSAFAHECYSNLLAARGHFKEGIAEILRAEELDPQSPRAKVLTGWTLYQARQYDASLEKIRAANAMQKDFPQGLLHLGNVLTAIGELDEAVAALRQSAELWGDSGMPRYMLAFARAAQGDTEAVGKILKKLLSTVERKHIKAYFVAMTYVAAGDFDMAFEWFQKAIDEGNEWMIWFGVDPKLDAIRKDARYKEILRQTNNPIADGPTTSETGERERSIAVLPFRALDQRGTDTTASEFLSLGLADAVTMRLSNIRRFVVRPTSSVVSFIGKGLDPSTAGKLLGVEFVVDGLIRRIGGKVRVTAQLLFVPDNSTIWAGSFSGSSDDVLELEDVISEQVMKQLVPRLTGEEQVRLSRRGTSDPAAYEHYLQGRYFWNQFLPDSFLSAIAAFEKAITEDPNYALAHVGVADYYTWSVIYGMIAPNEGFPKVRQFAARALEIDPSLAEAHAAMGLYHSNMQRWERSEEFSRRAIDLNPNYPLAHEWLSATLVGTGRFEEGTREIEIAERLDPLSLRPKVLTAWTIYQTRDYERALAKAREIETLDADYMQTHLQLANILLEIGELDEGLRHAQRAVELEPEAPLPFYMLCWALAAEGSVDDARRIVVKWVSNSGQRYVPPYFLALGYLSLGETERALENIEAAVDEHSPWTLWFGTEPKLDSLRGEQRFVEAVVKLGLPQFEGSKID